MKKNTLLFLIFIFTALTVSYGQDPLYLEAHYSFSSNALDESGNENHGLLIGDIDLVPDREGNPDCAYSFTGPSDYILVNYSEDFNILPTDSLSISLWFKGHSASGADLEYMFKKKNTTGEAMGAGNDYYIGLHDLNKPIMGSDYAHVWGPDSFPEDEWHHMVGVYNNEEWFLYIDNMLVGTDFDGSSIFSSTGEIRIGENYEGILDDIRFYSTSLSPDEIENLFLLPTDCEPSVDSYSTLTVNSCMDSVISPSGDTVWYDEGFYLDTIPNYAGFDSIITVSVNFGEASYHELDTTVCMEYISPSGGYTYFESGIYSDTLINVSGCDSIITINLTTLSNLTDEAIVSCDSYTVPSGDETYYENGEYYDTLVNIFGCDSVIMLDLTINSSSESVSVHEACESFIWIDGIEYTESSDDAFFTLTNEHGCDSIVTLNLTIHNLPEVVFNEPVNDVFCIGGDLIPMSGSPSGGEFSGPGMSVFVFNPIDAGIGFHTLYYTFEDENGCSNTDSIQVTVVDCLGINKDEKKTITVSPNPFNDFTTVDLGDETKSYSLIIYDLLGQEIYRNEKISGSTLILTKDELGSGIFLLSLIANNKTISTTKLVVQ